LVSPKTCVEISEVSVVNWQVWAQVCPSAVEIARKK
jgi:hypothetical protein